MELSKLEEIYAGSRARPSSDLITRPDVTRPLTEAAEIITDPLVDPAERLRDAMQAIEDLCAPFVGVETVDAPLIM